MYAKFFHGIARRGGEYPSERDYRLNYTDDRPLCLWKNVFRLGNFFCPGVPMVFSSLLFECVRLSRCDTESVIFDRPFYQEYDIGVDSMDYFGFRDYRQQQSFLYSLEGNPALATGLNFIAVYPMRGWSLLKERLSINNTELAACCERFSSETALLDILGDKVIETLGVIDARNLTDGWLLSSHVFEALKSDLDPYFFEFRVVR